MSETNTETGERSSNLLYCGESVDNMTREELIEALREVGRAYERVLLDSKDMLSRLI